MMAVVIEVLVLGGVGDRKFALVGWLAVAALVADIYELRLHVALL